MGQQGMKYPGYNGFGGVKILQWVHAWMFSWFAQYKWHKPTSGEYETRAGLEPAPKSLQRAV